MSAKKFDSILKNCVKLNESLTGRRDNTAFDWDVAGCEFGYLKVDPKLRTVLVHGYDEHPHCGAEIERVDEKYEGDKALEILIKLEETLKSQFIAHETQRLQEERKKRALDAQAKQDKLAAQEAMNILLSQK